MTLPTLNLDDEALAVRELLESTSQNIVEIGQRLIKIREALEGEFLGWIEAEFSMSQASAYRFISVAKRFETAPEGIAPAALYELASPSTPPEVREEIVERAAQGETFTRADIQREKEKKTAAKKQRRELREVELAAKQQELPKKVYGVILCDVPSRFEVRSELGMDRAAENHYPTMTVDELSAFAIDDIAADDCVLFFWSTSPQLRNSMRILTAWDFEYRSSVVWVKDAVGTGYWFRSQHEILLVATRGSVPAPAMGTQWPSIIDARRGRHSAKPSSTYELIEAYFPTLSKIELFARAAREGWDRHGLEAPEAPAIGGNGQHNGDSDPKDLDSNAGAGEESDTDDPAPFAQLQFDKAGFVPADH